MSYDGELNHDQSVPESMLLPMKGDNVMTRNEQMKDRFDTHKGEFTLTIKGMDVWLHGIVVPCKNGKDAVEDWYMFKSNCGGYVVFNTDDVCVVTRNDVISLYHPLEIANVRLDRQEVPR
jgi:hypothetical protein